MQAIFGTRSENLKTDIEAYLGTAGADADAPVESERRPEAPRPAKLSSAPGPGIRPDVFGRAAEIARALGGLRNLQTVEACAITRIRISLVDARSIDEVALRTAGVPALMRLGPNLVHGIVGTTPRQSLPIAGVARASATRRSAEIWPGPRWSLSAPKRLSRAQ